MNETRFLEIVELAKQRLSAISTADGFNLPLGQAVYVDGLQPVPLDDHNAPLPETVLIDPGEVSMNPGSGEIRSSTATLEAKFSREVSVIVIWPIDDKSQWLRISELIAQDVRKAMFADQFEWQQIGVAKLNQIGQESSWPEAASVVLAVKIDFQIDYVEQ